MGLLSKARDLVTLSSREYDPSALSGTELLRQKLYMIRAHYADSNHGSDGTEDCPLYYASIEGIGGSTSQTVASLRNLPKKGAAKDYRMVSMFNHVPKMIRTDVNCMMNDFKWDRLRVEVDGTEDEALSELAQDIFKEAEARSLWRLPTLIRTAGPRADGYTRPKLDKTFKTGIALHLALAEGIFPAFDTWQANRAVAYRAVYSVMAEPLPTDPEGFTTSSGTRETHVERLDARGVTVYKNGIPVTHDDAGNLLSGPHPAGLDEIPMVHTAYRDSGEFFGIAVADADTVADIDAANVSAGNLKHMIDGVFGTPNLFMYGVSDNGNFVWGSRGVHGLPVDGRAELLHFQGIPDLISEIQMKSAALRDKIPQFIIDDVRGESSQESGVALAIRLFPYDSYLAELEQQLTRTLQDIVRIALKLLGRYPVGRQFEVCMDWGARFPVDIMARLSAAKVQVELFGQVPELIEELARREGYPQEIIDAIAKFHKEKAETEAQAASTNAFGGGLIGASMAQRMKQQGQTAAGTAAGAMQIADGQ